MSATKQLMDAAMTARGLTTPYQLAKALSTSIQRVLKWADGTSECDDDAAAAMAELAGLPPERAVLLVAASRVKSADVRKRLRAAAERLAA